MTVLIPLLGPATGFQPPPPPYEPPSEDGEQAAVDYSQNALSDGEARASLNELVSNNCCWGKGPAENLKIVNIVPSSAFKVRAVCDGEIVTVHWRGW